MTTIMPHPFRVAIILLVVFFIGGCMSSTPTRNYAAAPAASPNPPAAAIPIAPVKNGGVEVSVQGVSRSGDPSYRLPHPGYIQIEVTIRNTTSAPLEILETHMRVSDGTAIIALNEAEVIPILNGQVAGTVGVLGAATTIASGIPVINTIVGLGSMVGHNLVQGARTSERDALSATMLQNRTIPPGSMSSGVVIFKDDGREPNAFIVSFLPGGSLDLSRSQSVIVPLDQPEVAATTP